MSAPINVKAHPKFKPLYSLPADIDFVIAIGGRGGMKTYEISKFCAFDATINKRRQGIFRDEKVTIKETILAEIFNRFDTANQYGHFDGMYEKLENGIKDLTTDNMLVFTKGFRASSNQKVSNLKGLSEVDTAVVEEGDDIRDPTKFNTFKDTIRTQRRLIIIILNTPDIQHWIVKRYFILEPITKADVTELKHITNNDIDGFWKLIPKDVPGFYCIQSSYADNQYLPEGVIRDYKAYGDPGSPTYDLHYYLTAIRGFASSGRKGQILKKVRPISLMEYFALPYKEVYGQDFGTAKPAGTIGAKLHGNSMWVRQINYKPLDAMGIGKLYRDEGITENDVIIADSAEPTTIADLRNGWQAAETDDGKAIPGLNVYAAIKPPGSINAGLSDLIGTNLYFCEESTDLWNEVYNYVYALNKSGEPTNDPIDDFNHLIDPTRYVKMSHGRHF